MDVREMFMFAGSTYFSLSKYSFCGVFIVGGNANSKAIKCLKKLS